MGSPFPLLSSGQSIPDDRQGLSPRDFGLVPQTPQIRAHHSMTSDQNVPQTPDVAVVPSNPATHLTSDLCDTPTPCYAAEASPSVPGQDTPTVLHDQQVPATPHGGALPPTHQSPGSYYTHATSTPSSQSQSSQETTVTTDHNSSTIHTPQQSALTGKLRTQFNRLNTPRHSRRLSHMRQTPSLSSRRRLSLAPCSRQNPQALGDKELIQHITMATNETHSSTRAGLFVTSSKSDQVGAPVQSQNSQTPCCSYLADSNVEHDKESVTIGYSPESNKLHAAGSSNNRGSIVSAVTTRPVATTPDPTSKQTGSDKETHPAPRVNCLEEEVIESPRQGEAIPKDRDKKAEIQKRVQHVMATTNVTNNTPGAANTSQAAMLEKTAENGKSVLTLFTDDDLYFG